MKPLTMIKRSEPSCGSCYACCNVFEISSLAKAANVDCIYLDKNGEHGCCKVYEDRPPACSNFRCQWKYNKVGNGKLAYRPDRLGIVVTIMDMPPFEGIIGIFKMKEQKISPRGKHFLRELERKELYFFNGSLYGPQHLIDEWRKKYEK
jgi:hypothetical protein